MARIYSDASLQGAASAGVGPPSGLPGALFVFDGADIVSTDIGDEWPDALGSDLVLSFTVNCDVVDTEFEGNRALRVPGGSFGGAQLSEYLPTPASVGGVLSVFVVFRLPSGAGGLINAAGAFSSVVMNGGGYLANVNGQAFDPTPVLRGGAAHVVELRYTPTTTIAYSDGAANLPADYMGSLAGSDIIFRLGRVDEGNWPSAAADFAYVTAAPNVTSDDRAAFLDMVASRFGVAI